MKTSILKNIHIYNWKLQAVYAISMVAGSIFAIAIFTVFVHSQSISAATSPNSQTDWSGGTTSGSVTTTVSTYESASNIVTGTAGQLSLSLQSDWGPSLTSWIYRKPITVTNNGSQLTNYQVRLSVAYDSDMQSDFDDLRFTNTSGTALDYWIQTKTDSVSATVWVEADTLTTAGNTTIYMYYGNAGATASSNGKDTFQLFDDFDDNSFDTNKWVEADPSSKISESGGKLKFIYGSGSGAWNAGVYSVDSFTRSDIAVEYDLRWVADYSPYDAFMFGWKDDGSGMSYTNLVYAYYNGGAGICSSSCAASAYEDGSSRSTSGTWNKDTDYLIRLRMRAAGGAYYEKSTDAGANFTTNYTSSYSTESNLHVAWSHYSGDYWIDNVRVRNWVSTEPTASFGGEQLKYVSSGTLTSNIFNAEFPADWGTLTYSSTASGTVTVKVRSDSNSDMSTATSWSSCSAISSGTDLTTTDCVSDITQYLQYQITLQPSSSDTPVFENINMTFTASDSIAPDVNATSTAISNLADSGAWTRNGVTVTWTAGSDNSGGVGLAGYCIALDEVAVTGSETSNILDPASTAGSLLNAIDDGITNNSSCGFIVAGTGVNLSNISGLTLTTGKHYYVSVKAVDLSGNVYTGASNTFQDLVDFKYDSMAPTNVSYISAPSTVFGNVADMSFSWPSSGGSVSSDANSGLLGWQYSLDAGVTWRGPDTSASLGITYIDDDSSTYSHTFTEGDDGRDIAVGINTVYLRTVDAAGNYSSAATYRTAPLNFGGEAPTFSIACDLPTGVTVSPATSTSNSFALSWDAATATGANTIAGYYYMINTSPPSTLSTLRSNSTQYIGVGTSASISATPLTGSVKGSNTIYVVSYDSENNYSQSNCLKGTYTLNSTLPDPVRSLSASDASIKSDELWRASITWSSPIYKGTGTLTYKIERSTDNTTWTSVTTTSGTAYTDTVDNSTTYYYRVGVYDTTSESQAAPTYAISVSVYPKGTWISAPTLSGDPTVTGITTKKATINWSTSRTADSKVQYGNSTGSYFDEEPSTSEQETSHEIKLTNLSPGTKYYYKVKWTDEDGNTDSSAEQTFTTDPAPVVSDVTPSDISLASVYINFTTANAVKATIYYGTSTAYGGIKSVTTSSSESTYNVQLTGLLDGTVYHYKIQLEDSEEDTYDFEDHIFETLPRPRITTIQIEEVKGTAQPTVLVSWNTNTPVSSIITYYPAGKEAEAKDEVNVTLKEGQHKIVLQDLIPQTKYSMLVKGRDLIGNEAVSDIQTFTTATDTRPPQIVNLTLKGTTQQTPTGAGRQEAQAQLIVTWDTDEPSTSQVEIGEGSGTTYSQKTQEDVSLTTNHIVIISNLTPSKVYHLRAASKDSIGNVGASLDTVTITPKSTDSAFDLVIGNLSELFGFLGAIK